MHARQATRIDHADSRARASRLARLTHGMAVRSVFTRKTPLTMNDLGPLLSSAEYIIRDCCNGYPDEQQLRDWFDEVVCQIGSLMPNGWTQQTSRMVICACRTHWIFVDVLLQTGWTPMLYEFAKIRWIVRATAFWPYEDPYIGLYRAVIGTIWRFSTLTEEEKSALWHEQARLRGGFQNDRESALVPGDA